MDSLGKTINNLSLYDVKHYVRKAQNAVLNLSEVEAKVREATNNEPWGASSSLMAEIARGTFNFKDREETCSLIFRRFTEKGAHEWRQIYKALQLEEYLVKHGSERFVDDARSNVNLVSMLKSFHYIDSKGVDQGINVRNRARALAALLEDEAKIRQERRKAKENAKKYGGVSSAAFGGASSFHSSSSSVGGGSGAGGAGVTVDDDGFERRVFGDGGMYGQRFNDTAATQAAGATYETARAAVRPRGRGGRFEEYTVEGETTSKPAKKAPASDLVSFGDVAAAPAAAQTAPAPADDDDDDDFDDFQSATPATPAPSQPSANLADLLTSSYSAQKPLPSEPFGTPSVTTSAPVSAPAARPAPKADLFGSLLVSAKTKTAGMPARPAARPAAYTTPSAATTTTTTTTTASSNTGNSMDLLDL